MEIENIKIPLQLQRNEFAFVKLKGTSKIPLEKVGKRKAILFKIFSPTSYKATTMEF